MGCCVEDPDPGYSAFSTPGSGIRLSTELTHSFSVQYLLKNFYCFEIMATLWLGLVSENEGNFFKTNDGLLFENLNFFKNQGLAQGYTALILYLAYLHKMLIVQEFFNAT